MGQALLSIILITPRFISKQLCHNHDSRIYESQFTCWEAQFQADIRFWVWLIPTLPTFALRLESVDTMITIVQSRC